MHFPSVRCTLATSQCNPKNIKIIFFLKMEMNSTIVHRRYHRIFGRVRDRCCLRRKVNIADRMSLVPGLPPPLHSQRSDFNQKAIRAIGNVHPLFQIPWRYRCESFSKPAYENPPEAEFRAGPLRSKHSALSGAAGSMLTSDSATHYNEEFSGLNLCRWSDWQPQLRSPVFQTKKMKAAITPATMSIQY
jgi:hypothetical protein